MIIEIEKNSDSALSQAICYGDFLLEKKLLGNDLLGWEVANKTPDGKCWNNPENLDTGVSGILLFLLELYRCTGETRYLTAVDDAIPNLIEYCKNTPTDNYALYTGRCGVVYLLLQRCKLNKIDSHLSAAIELIRFSNLRFLHSEYTTDYLYNGRAGTLLALLHLYKATGEEFLVKYITDYYNKILGNAKIADNKIYWQNKEEIHIRPSCGFANGVAGISYVLGEMNRYIKSNYLQAFKNNADAYISSCWKSDYGNWGNYEKQLSSLQEFDTCMNAFKNNDATFFEPTNDPGWATGATGILISGHNLPERSNVDMDIIESLFSRSSFSLYNGLAGMGSYYYQQQNNEAIARLKKELLQIDFTASQNWKTSEGLMHGLTGLFYFLVKTEGEDKKDENILLPFFADGDQWSDIVIPFNETEVKRSILQKSYPRILMLLEMFFPSVLTDFYTDSSFINWQGESQEFDLFIRNLQVDRIPAQQYKRVLDLLELEGNKTRIIREEVRSTLEIYLSTIIYQDKITEMLNRPDEWLLDQRIVFSNNFLTIETKWNWCHENALGITSRKQMKESFSKNLTEEESNFSLLLQVTGKKEITEAMLNEKTSIRTLIWQRFSTPTKIGECIADVKSTISQMPPFLIKKWVLPELNYKVPATIEEIIYELDWVILKYIKPLLYRGIVVFCD